MGCLRAMNLVFIGPFAFKPKGTVSARAFLIARALVRRGHRVTILMPPYDNLADSGRAWAEDGVRLENMVLRRNDAWHQLTVPLRMARRATRLGPDAVHVFKPIGYSGLAAVALRLFSRRPLVVDTDDWEGKGGWSDVNPYPALWKALFAWQERWLARRAGAVTVASRCLQEQVAGFGADPARVFYLPNGPDGRWRDLAAAGDEDRARVRAELGVGEAWEYEGCPIVNTGPDSPVGHVHPTDLQIQPGHILHIDFGVKQDGLLHRRAIPQGTALQVGDVIVVNVLAVDKERGRISLGWADRQAGD